MTPDSPPTPVRNICTSAVPGRLGEVNCWIFDMDNTLYGPQANLFAQIDRRMEAFVADLLGLSRAEARLVQKRYFYEYGTTLRGLMLGHGVNPHGFLSYVHDIDTSVLDANARLHRALTRLPGRRIVFTNGDATYAEKVLTALGIRDAFDAVYDICAMDFRPKPDPASYAGLCTRLAIDPTRAFFVDDMAHNLQPAHQLGMVTAWVDNGSERGSHGHSPTYIDYELADITDWLEQIF